MDGAIRRSSLTEHLPHPFQATQTLTISPGSHGSKASEIMIQQVGVQVKFNTVVCVYGCGYSKKVVSIKVPLGMAKGSLPHLQYRD